MEKKILSSKNFQRDLYDLGPKNLVQVHFPHALTYSQFEKKFGHWERHHSPKLDFKEISAMTFKCVLRSLHTLYAQELFYIKYEPDKVRGENIGSGQLFFFFTDVLYDLKL